MIIILTPSVLKHDKKDAVRTSEISQGKNMKREKYLIYWLVYNARMWEGLTPFIKVTRLKAQRKVFFSMKEVNGNIKKFWNAERRQSLHHIPDNFLWI